MKLYNEAYPLYLSDKIRDQWTSKRDFKKIDDLKGFIALAMCDYKLLGKHFSQMILFDTAEHREVGGMLLESRGVDMREVAVSEAIKLKNPMPVFADYRNHPNFTKEINSPLKIYNDKIVLNGDQVNKICHSVGEALEKNQINVVSFYNLKELSLPRVSIVIGAYTYNFATNQNEGTIMFEKYLFNDKLFKVEVAPIYGEDNKLVHNQVKLIFQAPTMVKTDRQYGRDIEMFLAVNYFIKNIPSSYQETKKKVSETIEIGKGHNRKYKQVVHLERSYDFQNLDKMSRTHIKHIFTCLCWGVRGHFRHLKNGKVIFIQPFTKGKERANMSAFSEKEYRL